MELHLFSTPGKEDMRYVLAAARSILEGKEEPLVAYLPAASLSNSWLEFTERAFKGLARLESIETELMSLTQMETLLRRADLVYIPGGNTFLLNHRLHLSKVFDFLRKKVLAGLPLIGVSAGTVLCGRNILTSRDMNMVESGVFEGLGVSPFNFSVHYPDDLVSRANTDEWLLDYHIFHDNPLLTMADDAYVRVEGKKVRLESGEAWILRKGESKEKLVEGKIIEP